MGRKNESLFNLRVLQKRASNKGSWKTQHDYARLLASRSRSQCCGCDCKPAPSSQTCGTAIVVAGTLYPRPEFQQVGCAAVRAAKQLFTRRCTPTRTILVKW